MDIRDSIKLVGDRLLNKNVEELLTIDEKYEQSQYDCENALSKVPTYTQDILSQVNFRESDNNQSPLKT